MPDDKRVEQLGECVVLGRLKATYLNMRLSKKLLLVFGALLAVVCAAALTALQVSFAIYDARLYEQSVQELDYFAKETGDALDGVEAFTTQLVSDRYLQDQLTTLVELDGYADGYSYALGQLRSHLAGSAAGRTDVTSLVYLAPSGAMITTGRASGWLSPDMIASLISRFDEARGGYVELAPSEAFPYLIGGRAVLRYTDMSLDNMGYLFAVVDVGEVIDSRISTLSAGHAALFVYTPDRMIYQGADERPADLPAKPGAHGYRVVGAVDSRHFLGYLTDARTGWIFALWTPYSQVFGQFQTLRLGVLLAFAAVAAAAVLVIRQLARQITMPLDQLAGAMGIVMTGDFHRASATLPAATAKDEVGELTAEFSVMLQKIDELIEDDRKKQNLLQDTRYRMLQAQINPHFLYNTLNSLSWLIRAGRNVEAQKMTVELGSLLRASLSGRMDSTVAEEIGLVRSYIAIQGSRYAESARFEILTKGDLSQCPLPHLTLQPLVENAIKYGVECSSDVCLVRISANRDAERVRIEVRDEGPGMDAERLQGVMDGSARPRGNGLGIANIRERLRYMFGSEASFAIASEAGAGTTVTIVVPVKALREQEGESSRRRAARHA